MQVAWFILPLIRRHRARAGGRASLSRENTPPFSEQAKPLRPPDLPSNMLLLAALLFGGALLNPAPGLAAAGSKHIYIVRHGKKIHTGDDLAAEFECLSEEGWARAYNLKSVFSIGGEHATPGAIFSADLCRRWRPIAEIATAGFTGAVSQRLRHSRESACRFYFASPLSLKRRRRWWLCELGEEQQ